jgi:hypothetical protein
MSVSKGVRGAVSRVAGIPMRRALRPNAARRRRPVTIMTGN